MRITGSGVWGPPLDAPGAIAVLRRAVELGVTFIDTAESYGPHVSEALIAEALHPYPGDLVIATKGGFDRPGPGQWIPNGRPSRLREEIEGSLRRLKLDRIDLYQLHRIDPAVPEEEQFGTLQVLQREGIPWYPLLVGKIGQSDPLAHLAATRAVTPSQLALAWLLHRSPVVVPIPGTSQVAHLEENIRAASITLSPTEFASLG